MEEMFGVEGAALFGAWESQYKLITGDVRSGAANGAADPYYKLKKQIQDEAIGFQEKRQKLWKRVGVSLAILAVLGLSAASSGDALLGIVFGSIPLAWTIWRNKVHNGELYAAIKFDEQYFDGEIFSRIRNDRLL